MAATGEDPFQHLRVGECRLERTCERRIPDHHHTLDSGRAWLGERDWSRSNEIALVPGVSQRAERVAPIDDA